MHPRKQQYALEIYKIIGDFCLANSISNPAPSSALPVVLGISSEETQKIINKILIALPDWIFYLSEPDSINEILGFIAQRYVLFQVQEDIKNELYPMLLINFISGLIEELSQRYYPQDLKG